MSEGSAAPNIILILADHFRADAVGASTPNLRALANRGASFEHAYTASPLCQPARASIITGLYPSGHGICGNMAEPLPAEQRADTFMHHLREAGYHTALVGRHHYVDGYGIEGMDFTELDEDIAGFGFDHVFQVLNPCEHAYNECEFTRVLRQKGLHERYIEALGRTGDGFPFEEEYYEDAFIARAACEFVETCDADRPFYLNIGLSGPHPPYWHPGQQHRPEDVPPPIGAPDTGDVRRRRADYMDKCALIDRYVGWVVEALQRRGMLENTVIIFTSDHGDMLGDHGIWDKRHFYEQSAGVPLILAGPGVTVGARGLTGKRSKQLASHLDLYPTILRLAGVDEAPLRRRPGLDLLAMLRDEGGAARDAVFSEVASQVMVRTAGWKLVFDAESGVEHMYNLRTDLTEERNLAGDPRYDGVAAVLIERLLANRILLTQYTHDKEEQRLQRVRVRRPE